MPGIILSQGIEQPAQLLMVCQGALGQRCVSGLCSSGSNDVSSNWKCGSSSFENE